MRYLTYYISLQLSPERCDVEHKASPDRTLKRPLQVLVEGVRVLGLYRPLGAVVVHAPIVSCKVGRQDRQCEYITFNTLYFTALLLGFAAYI